jgi:hypothetical protein
MMEHTETQKTEKLYKYEEAPEVLELKEHEKFKDVNGTTIKIEVRGTRKHNDCYFRVKDVSDGFGLPNIQTTINNKENCYELGIHYKVFNTPIMLKGYDGSNKKSNKRVLYLTFLGMLRVLFCSRTSGNAEKFQIWATEKLFTVQMGAAEDRDELAAELIGVNAKTVGDVFRANSSKTPSVYLIYIGAAAELLRPYIYDRPNVM